MLTIGIDVGLTGAIAALDQFGQVVALADLPTKRPEVSVHQVDAAELGRMLTDIRDGKPCRVFVEKLQSIGGLSGRKTCFSMGQSLGVVVATLDIYALPYEYVAPHVWKRELRLQFAAKTSDQIKKQASMAKAQNLWPSRRDDLDKAKHHNRAEALLIAYYGWRLTAPSASAA